MRIGFTGTRHGMTSHQLTTMEILLRELDPIEFHHGDCVGADKDAHMLIYSHFPECLIHIHPPEKQEYRALSHVATSELLIEFHPLKEYLERDRDIVDACDCLIAAPKTAGEVRQSGTWYTVRYGWWSKKTVFVIRPDGTISI